MPTPLSNLKERRPKNPFQSAPRRSDIAQHRQGEPRFRSITSVFHIPTREITQHGYIQIWHRIMPICGLVAPSLFVASQGNLLYNCVRLGPESHQSTTCIRHTNSQHTNLTAFAHDAIGLACEHYAIRSYCQSLKRSCQLARHAWTSSRLSYFPIWRIFIDPLLLGCIGTFLDEASGWNTPQIVRVSSLVVPVATWCA